LLQCLSLLTQLLVVPGNSVRVTALLTVLLDASAAQSYSHLPVDEGWCEATEVLALFRVRPALVSPMHCHQGVQVLPVSRSKRHLLGLPVVGTPVREVLQALNLDTAVGRLSIDQRVLVDIRLSPKSLVVVLFELSLLCFWLVR
jgi:hypothetical protein